LRLQNFEKSGVKQAGLKDYEFHPLLLVSLGNYVLFIIP